MSVAVSLGRALPQSLDTFINRTVAEGAAPVPNVELNTQVPDLGPYVLDLGGVFELAVYPGPSLRFRAEPTVGKNLNTTA